MNLYIQTKIQYQLYSRQIDCDHLIVLSQVQNRHKHPAYEELLHLTEH